MEIVEPSPFIYVLKNSLEDSLCDGLMRLFEEHPQDVLGPDKMPQNSESNTRKEYEQIELSNRSQFETFDTALNKALGEGIQELKGHLHANLMIHPDRPFQDWYYPNESPIDMSFKFDDGYQLQRCSMEHNLKGYIMHSDEHGDKHGWRQLAFMWFLNDDFEGGATFFNFQNFYLRPQKGALVFFPTTWTHIHTGLSPKIGWKYIVCGWVFDRDNFSTPFFDTAAGRHQEGS
jgi:hypothetical protein|tara:strand:- start:1232 stop:1927 length:696 start_codon:yes stop_codon:yes gene_type:complete